MLVELNIDALVGPTHHYGGIGHGNMASSDHQHQPSHPRRAALEGLEKALLVAGLGVPQFILPPPRRPMATLLGTIGFDGNFADQCQQAREFAPSAYSAAFSSAFMWAANAATFAPGCDCVDGRHHLTLANLCSSWHRLPESQQRKPQFMQMLAGLSDQLSLHDALPPIMPLRDEGAANHMRLCDESGERGLHLFVYGESDSQSKPQRFVARHTLAASQAICRLHRLPPDQTIYLQQHPRAIDAGVFHNDVIATSHQGVLLHHELAFQQSESELAEIDARYQQLCGRPLIRICVHESELSLDEAVKSYLFNSQILTPALGDRGQSQDQPRMVLLCAAQCQRMRSARTLIESWVADPRNPIDAVHYVSLDESMSNGGGPACLRLRMQMPLRDIDRIDHRYRLTPQLAEALHQVIEETYPERLDYLNLAAPESLAQYAESYERLDALFSVAIS